MGDKSKIEWTDATWNPTTGCSRVSSGCDNCYAMTMAKRIQAMGTTDAYDGTTRDTKHGVDWTGIVHLHEDRLDQPIRWQRPRRIFVNSMSDLFHPSVPFNFVDEVFLVMQEAGHHIFQVLTKRPDRMSMYMHGREDILWETPPPNIWLGTSVEHQEAANERVPHLANCPAAMRFLSCEPLLGAVDLSQIPEAGFRRTFNPLNGKIYDWDYEEWIDDEHYETLDWVIVGGESGHNARPMNPDWVRSLRDQCCNADVAFFFKQWGAWMPLDTACGGPGMWSKDPMPGKYRGPYDGKPYHLFQEDSMAGPSLIRVGKKEAGRTLDRRTWDEMPIELEAA